MMKWMAGAAFASAALLGSAATPAQGQTAQLIAERMATLRKHSDRVVVIGERLSAAAARAGWCETVPSVGWALSDIGEYPKSYRAAALREWTVPTATATYISALSPNGAAARAGMTTGLGVVEINGSPPMRNTSALPSPFARMNSERLVDRALEAGTLSVVTVDRTGNRRTWELVGQPVCDTRFGVSPDDDEQAYADGDTVQVTAGMGQFTDGNDDELAAVIAHELAHNILRHIPRQQEAGTPRNYTRYLGRYTNINRSMEEEADRLSVWLLALAGFSPQSPVSFWQRFGPGHDSAHPLGRTHDQWPDRVAALNNELERMASAKAANPDARPQLLDRRDLVPVPGARPDIGADIGANAEPQ